MLNWQPQPEGLNQLTQLLRDSMSANNAVQTQVREQLESFRNVPDYNNYLIYILTQMPQELPTTRAIAGLLLKTNIQYHSNEIREDVLEYVKALALRHVGDPDPDVRNTLGTVITTILSRNSIMSWPEVLPHLMGLLDSQDPYVVEGAFKALAKICEDSGDELDMDINGERPLNFMIPKIITYFKSPVVTIRVCALTCINQFITRKSQSFMVNIDAFVEGLGHLSNDTHPDVRKHVCQAMVMLLEVRPDKLIPQINNVVEYMLYSTKDDDESVALEACEFWLAFAEQDALKEHLRPHLNRVIPVLLQGMVYSELDIISLDVDDEDGAVPDRPEDMKPRFHHAKTHATENTAAGSEGAGGDGDSVLEDDDDEDDEDDDDDIYMEWNLRKCSASALDVLSSVYGNSMLEILLPLLQTELFHTEWKHRECGILALGAVAEGCMSGIEPHLPTLVPYLISTLKDSKSLVRAITCWTLGRYARWCVYPTNPEDRTKYLVPLIEGLLSMVNDSNKRVQEAGCSAFATLEEEACEHLVPYLFGILQTLVHAFSTYQQKNLLILYDAIGTLADSVGNALNKKEYIDLLMPCLIEKWQRLQDDDRDLFPLFECLSSVTTALGQGFLPFAPPVFERCVKIVHANLMQAQMHVQNPENVPQPDKDFMIVALDLLSGLTQGLNTSVESLVASSQPSVLQILSVCLADSSAEVRQSSYALLGDLAISCFMHIKPYLNAFMNELIGQIQPNTDFVSVCNNAAWAAGEIALQYGENMGVWVQPLLERLIPLLTNETTPRTLLDNSAITIGRLGLVCPQLVGPHLEAFAEAWCHTCRTIRDNDEKDTAFRGLCAMIQVNPQGLIKSLAPFCDAVAQWSEVPPELDQQFGKILQGYKNMMGGQWDAFAASLAPDTRNRLAQRYAL
ncbi:MAG: armadillo-type protein [Benniella sp.]|nr:MAG: armadillo-type protein [Benniella sp.]